MREKLSITEAARKFGINSSTWHRAVQDGRIPAPTHRGRTPAKRVYLVAEAEAAAAWFGRRHTTPDGMVSLADAARQTEYSYRAVATYAKRYGIGTKSWGRVWLTDEDVKRLYELMGVSK